MELPPPSRGFSTRNHSPHAGIARGRLLCLPYVIFMYNFEEGTQPMHTVNLRQVGGSLMLAVPPPLARELHLQPSSRVVVRAEQGRLIVNPQPRPKYTLAELLAQCQPKARRQKQDRSWSAGGPVGREIL